VGGSALPDTAKSRPKHCLPRCGSSSYLRPADWATGSARHGQYTASPDAAGSVRHCLIGEGSTASRDDEAEKHCESVGDPLDLLPRRYRRRRVGHCIDASFIGATSGARGKCIAPNTLPKLRGTTSRAGATVRDSECSC
jgi:hypothetical protein